MGTLVAEMAYEEKRFNTLSRSRPKFKGRRSKMIFKRKVSNWNFEIQKTLPKQYGKI